MAELSAHVRGGEIRDRLRRRRIKRELGWLLERRYGERQRVVVVDEVTPAGKPGFLEWIGGSRSPAAVAVPWKNAQLLDWPPGHPHTDVLYIAHPMAQLSYLPAAHFHRQVFESKFRDLVRLLAGLGATSIEISGDRARSGTFSSEVEAPSGLVAAEVGRTTSSSHMIRYSGRFPGGRAPSVPPGLVWFGAEPSWQSLAEQRLHHRVSHFELALTYLDDFGVTADLGSIKFRGRRLKLGGEFEKHERIEWRVAADFAAPAAGLIPPAP